MVASKEAENYLSKNFMRSENLMQFDSNNEEISFPDFDNADYYICGKKYLELIKCVKWISNIDTFLIKLLKQAIGMESLFSIVL